MEIVRKRYLFIVLCFLISSLVAQEVEIEEEGYNQQGTEEVGPDSISESVPKSTISPREELEQAKNHEEKKNYEKAIEHYLRLAKHNPNNADYFYKLGLLYSRIGDNTNAEKYYLLCLVLVPEYTDARVGLANVYSRIGDEEEAINQLEIVLKDDPGNPDALSSLARIHSRKGNTEKTKQLYAELLKVDPDNTGARWNRARSNLVSYRHREAFKDYRYLYNYAEGGKDRFYNEMAYLRPLVYPSIKGYGSYSKEIEEDLVTKLLTTRINSLFYFGELVIPITDNFRTTFRAGNAPVRQINLLANLNNYNMNSPFASVRLEANYWNYSFDGKMQVTWGKDKKSTPRNRFPFRYVRLWEPSFQWKYSSDQHIAIFSAYRDSFIGRNFSDIDFSYFVKRTEISPVYEYRFSYPFTAIGVKGLLGWYRGVQGNKKKEGEYWFRTQIPILPESTANILVTYVGNYSSYEHVDPDYFSYRRRWIQKGKIALLKTWGAKGTVELSYTYLWERDIDFVNVGEAIVTPSAPTPETLNKNIFMANIFEFLAKAMIKTVLEGEVSVKWYKNTNNYQTFSVEGRGRYMF